MSLNGFSVENLRFSGNGGNMDYQIFERQLQKAYNNSHCTFAFSDCLEIFTLYFDYYYQYLGREHPHLRTEKLTEFLNDIDGEGMFEPDCYPYMIEAYFNAPLKCDCNISHFFSGDIRLLRFYETCY